MDYRKHYDALMNRAKARGTRKKDLPFYTERHRILPGCMGGKYTKSNIALLTPEEHYVAHQLLVKMHPEHGGLVNAAHMMTMNGENHGENRYSNKMYGWLKRRYVNECKKRTGENNGSYGRRWYHDPETGEAGKFLDDEVPKGWVKGRIPVRESPRKHIRTTDRKKLTAIEINEKISHTLYGRVVKSETRKKISESLSGRTIPKETRDKMAISAKNRTSPSKEAKEKMSLAAKSRENNTKGTIWITNGSSNRRIHPDSEIESGWWKGRT